MSIAQKLWLGFGTLIGLMVLVLAVVLMWVRTIGSQVDEMATMAGPVSQSALRLELKANEVTAEIADYLQTPDVKNRQAITKQFSQFHDLLLAHRQVLSLPTEIELAEQTADLFARYQEQSLELLDQREKQAVTAEQMASLLELRVRLENVLDQSQLLQEARIEPVREQVIESISRLQSATLVLLGSGVVIAALAAVAVGRGILLTENELEVSAMRKSAILDHALDGIVTINGAGEILEFNPAAERIFGYRSEEILHQEMARLIIPTEFRDAHRAGLDRQRENLPSKILGQRLELTALRQNGEAFPVELSIVRIGSPAQPMYTGFLRDISERKRAEADLSERVKLLRLSSEVGVALTQGHDLHQVLHGCTAAIVKNLDAAFSRIWLLDPASDMLILKASSGMFTHLDGEHSRIPVGKYKIGMIAERRRPHLTNNVIGDPRVPEQDWAAGEGMVAFAGFPLLVDRHLVGVLGMFFKHAISETVVDGMATIANEIAIGIRHELSQAELLKSYEALEDRVQERTAELNLSNQALVRSNHELEQFASVASHDLQEPLRKIQAFGERLHSNYGGSLDDQGRQYIERMQLSATRMRTLIDDLLTFSRVTTKARPFEAVDLGELAEEVVSDLDARIQETGGRVEWGPLPTIEADPLQMRQLLQNLIANGLKFRRAEVPPAVQITATIENDDPDYYVIRVADNGIGFDEAYLDRIFEVFQRLHGRQVFEGTGMGLAICRKIAERHGGAITARSEPNVGSTFIVRLPREQQEEELTND